VSRQGRDHVKATYRPTHRYVSQGRTWHGLAPDTTWRGRVWVPGIRVTSCDLRVLMDQPTKAISSYDGLCRHDGR
jgi:hypothetical protein